MIAEWWRSRTDARDIILRAVTIDSSVEAAKMAGVALASQRHVDATMTIDAIVMATAAQHDAIVVTGDVEDFARLADPFRSVRVIAI